MGAKKEKKISELSIWAKVAKDNHMTYGELQRQVTLGLVKVVDGKLIRCKRGNGK